MQASSSSAPRRSLRADGRPRVRSVATGDAATVLLDLPLPAELVQRSPVLAAAAETQAELPVSSVELTQWLHHHLYGSGFPPNSASTDGGARYTAKWRRGSAAYGNPVPAGSEPGEVAGSDEDSAESDDDEDWRDVRLPPPPPREPAHRVEQISERFAVWRVGSRDSGEASGHEAKARAAAQAAAALVDVCRRLGDDATAARLEARLRSGQGASAWLSA